MKTKVEFNIRGGIRLIEDVLPIYGLGIRWGAQTLVTFLSTFSIRKALTGRKEIDRMIVYLILQFNSLQQDHVSKKPAELLSAILSCHVHFLLLLLLSTGAQCHLL